MNLYLEKRNFLQAEEIGEKALDYYFKSIINLVDERDKFKNNLQCKIEERKIEQLINEIGEQGVKCGLCLQNLSICYEFRMNFEKSIECVILGYWLSLNILRENENKSSRVKDLRNYFKNILDDRKQKFKDYFQQEWEIKRILERGLSKKIEMEFEKEIQGNNEQSYDQILYKKYNFENLNKQQFILIKNQGPEFEDESSFALEKAYFKNKQQKQNQSFLDNIKNVKLNLHFTNSNSVIEGLNSGVNSSQLTNISQQTKNLNSENQQKTEESCCMTLNSNRAFTSQTPQKSNNQIFYLENLQYNSQDSQQQNQLNQTENLNKNQINQNLNNSGNQSPYRSPFSRKVSNQKSFLKNFSSKNQNSQIQYLTIQTTRQQILEKNPVKINYLNLEIDQQKNFDVDQVIGNIVKQKFNQVNSEQINPINNFQQLEEWNNVREKQDQKLNKIIEIENKKIQNKKNQGNNIQIGKKKKKNIQSMYELQNIVKIKSDVSLGYHKVFNQAEEIKKNKKDFVNQIKYQQHIKKHSSLNEILIHQADPNDLEEIIIQNRFENWNKNPTIVSYEAIKDQMIENKKRERKLEKFIQEKYKFCRLSTKISNNNIQMKQNSLRLITDQGRQNTEGELAAKSDIQNQTERLHFSKTNFIEKNKGLANSSVQFLFDSRKQTKQDELSPKQERVLKNSIFQRLHEQQKKSVQMRKSQNV